MSYTRKRTSSQSSNNYSNNSGGGSGGRSRQQRFSGGGGQNNNNNRPRKNYGAMREKYLAQARDALASGDRVLAESYFQHADHCFRMIAEENASRPPRQYPHNERHTPEPNTENNVAGEVAEATEITDEPIPSVLPAFLTESKPVVVAQNWEEE